MGARTTRIWRLLALVATLATAGAGCASGASTSPSPDRDKAGGGAPAITLRAGSPDGQGAPGALVLLAFADEVERLSAGRIRIDVEFQAVGDPTDFEPEMIKAVRDGSFDLGWVGSRAWDTQGVTTFDALQAPFLLTSYPVVDGVVSSPIASQMLAALDPAGFVGLGLYPDQLRHPVGFRSPLRSLDDFAGATIRVATSTTLDHMFRSLGATPVHLSGHAMEQAIDEHELDGADSSVGNAGSLPAGSIMTTNITPYAKTITLFADSKAFAALSENARDTLREAAKRALQFALDQDPETDDLEAFCDVGGTVVAASEADLRAIRAATQVVTIELQKDDATRSFIDQIQKIEAAAAPSATPPLPASCK